MFLSCSVGEAATPPKTGSVKKTALPLALSKKFFLRSFTELGSVTVPYVFSYVEIGRVRGPDLRNYYGELDYVTSLRCGRADKAPKWRSGVRGFSPHPRAVGLSYITTGYKNNS